MVKSVKVRDSENLSPSNIEKVIGLLNADKPITKKSACEILNIVYNTSRLQSIIDNYLSKKQNDKEQRAKKRYKAATEQEISYIIECTLQGDPVSSIADRLFRSSSFVANIIARTGTPKRTTGSSYFNPGLLPDDCVRESFTVGEKVFSSRYDSIATIIGEFPDSTRKVYKIYLEDERWQQFAYQPAEELGSLQHLKQYGVLI